MSQTWDIHSFFMHSKRNVYATSWSLYLLIGFLCKTKATFVSPLCWGGVSFSAAAVLSHCGHSMSLLPIASETSSVTGVYWVSHIIREPRKWWFLPWSQLCVWLTLLMESPVWEEVGRRTNTVLTWAVWKSYFLLKHICITLKISSVGNSGMPFWTPKTRTLFALQASPQTLGATVWYFKH